MCTRNHNHYVPSLFYICVPKITIMIYLSWDTEWNRQNFLSFWANFCPFSQLTTMNIKILTLKKTSWDIIILHIFTINDNHRYDAWFRRYGAKQTISCHSGPVFALLHPMHPENQIFGKINIVREDIVIVQMCTKNDSHMIYGSWDMKCNRQNFLSFWTIFCLFTLITTSKIKILKNW